MEAGLECWKETLALGVSKVERTGEHGMVLESEIRAEYGVRGME